MKNNNEQENKRRKVHHYKVNDKVLLKGIRATKYGTNPYEGPYTVIKVNRNGTVRLRKGRIEDV